MEPIIQQIYQYHRSTLDPALFRRQVASFEGRDVLILASGKGFGMRMDGTVTNGDVVNGDYSVDWFLLELRKYDGPITLTISTA